MTEIQKIIVGYAVNAVYLLLVILFGEMLNKKFKVNSETSRKIEHLLTGANWIFVYLFFGTTIHTFIFGVLCLITLILLTFAVKLESANREGHKYSLGLVYYGISSAILSALVSFVDGNWLPIYGIAYYCLALGDGFAPIIAKSVNKKHNPLIFEGKSIVGTFSVFAICTAVAFVFNALFNLELSVLFIFSIGCLAALAEIYGANGTDNLTIPLLVFLYLVLYINGHITLAIQLAIVLSLPFNVLSGLTKSLSFSATALSFIYVVGTAIFGGLEILVTVFVLYFIAAIVSKFTTKKFNEISQSIKAKAIRKWKQIFSNSIVALVFCILSYACNQPIFLFAALAVLSEEFADSISSDIGRLSKKPPIDILRFQRISRGISGGVSLLGLSSGFLASLVATSIPYAFYPEFTVTFLVVLVVSFLGTIIDSILGSSIQVLYKCPKCNSFTEKRMHCDTQAVQVKGLACVDNSMVNLLSGLFTGLITVLVLFLI